MTLNSFSRAFFDRVWTNSAYLVLSSYFTVFGQMVMVLVIVEVMTALVNSVAPQPSMIGRITGK
jgi:hypothetical protein